MPKGPAARIFDPVAHPAPGVLTPGPGSPNVLIGKKLAWRGVPAAAAAAISSAKAASDATIKTAEAATLAAAGTPGAPAAKAAEETTKAAVATSMGSMISVAAGGADIHACTTPLPIPPHGPGVVIDGSPTVLINGLPACRQGDTIIEAVGPPDKIVLGLPTVIIGDVPGPAGRGGSGSGAAPTPVMAAQSAAAAAVPPGPAARSSPTISKLAKSSGTLVGAPEAPPRNANSEMVRSISRQNEAAKTLSKHGLNVAQLPNTGRPGPNPDLNVDGKTADVYSPRTGSMNSIRGTIESKASSQAENVVVNLDDSPVAPEQLTSSLRDQPVPGAKNVYVIKNGEVWKVSN